MDEESWKDSTQGLEDCTSGFVPVVAALGNGVHGIESSSLLRQRRHFFRAKSRTKRRYFWSNDDGVFVTN